MSNPSSDSYRNALRHMGQDYSFAPRYIRGRDPHAPTNASNDIKPKEQQGYYPTGSFWTNSTNGNLWALQKITNNLANWILLSGGSSGPLLNITVPNGTSPIVPDGTGTVNFTSTGNTVTITGSSASPNNHTINFDVSGGSVLQEITGDDALPVVPTLGNINVTGVTVVNGTNVKPLYFKKNATSTEELDIQLTTTSTFAARNINNAGISSYDVTAFTVNAPTGFVQLIGGAGPATQTYQVDKAVAPGVNPVTPTAGGLLTVTGTNGIETDTLALNTITITNRNLALGVGNIGFTYAAATFTITDSSGVALSATNKATATFVDLNTQPLLTRTITTPFTFTDAAGTNELGANLFGTTTAIAWGNDCPFYLYAVLGNTTAPNDVGFAISRVPNRTIAPVAGNISISGNTNATTQGSFFFLKQNGSTITAANFASQPCVCIGSFRMQKSAGNAWTVQTLAATDGVGVYNENTTFTYPKNQNGAASGTHFLPVGGDTAPTFSTATCFYLINRLGVVSYILLYGGQTGNGVGTSSWSPTVPLTPILGKNTSVGWYATTAISNNFTSSISLNTNASSMLVKLNGVGGSLTVGGVTGGDASAQFNVDFNYISSLA